MHLPFGCPEPCTPSPGGQCSSLTPPPCPVTAKHPALHWGVRDSGLVPHLPIHHQGKGQLGKTNICKTPKATPEPPIPPDLATASLSTSAQHLFPPSLTPPSSNQTSLGTFPTETPGLRSRWDVKVGKGWGWPSLNSDWGSSWGICQVQGLPKPKRWGGGSFQPGRSLQE